MKKWLKKFGQIILWLLIGIFIGGWLIYTITLLKTDQQLTNAYIALGTLILAGATVLLAVLTWLNIKSSNEREERSRKERWLNEVIEWAEYLRKSSSESIDPSIIVYDTPIEQTATQRGFLLLRIKYQEINTKSAYVKEIVSKVFGQDLLSSVDKVIQKLHETIDMLGDCLTLKAKENSEKVEAYKKSLDSYAEDLIKEATNIKTEL